MSTCSITATGHLLVSFSRRPAVETKFHCEVSSHGSQTEQYHILRDFWGWCIERKAMDRKMFGRRWGIYVFLLRCKDQGPLDMVGHNIILPALSHPMCYDGRLSRCHIAFFTWTRPQNFIAQCMISSRKWSCRHYRSKFLEEMQMFRVFSRWVMCYWNASSMFMLKS